MIKLYHCRGARSARSLWLLNELDIDFELVELEFSMKGLRTPEYLSISPLGRVPCLTDGELTLFESGAICQYLCENYGDGSLYRAVGDPERNEWLQWLHYAETIAVHAASLVQQQVFIAPESARTS
jgi:glutathione S-transferase